MTDLIKFVQDQELFFNNSLTDETIKWEKESQFAIQSLQKNSYLAKIAQSNQISAQNAIINVAAIGITLNPAAKLAYLVPRDGAVCLDISYMGLLHLAMTTGSVLWGQCKLVHAADEYMSNGLDEAPTHRYNAFQDRGDIVGGYCTVKTPEGDYLTEEMSTDQINAIRDTSKAWQAYVGDKKKICPWVNHWEEMARKTIVKRASKYWPKTDRVDTAIHHLNTEGGEGVSEKVINPTIENAHERLVELTQDKDITKVLGWLSGAVGYEVSDIKELSEHQASEAVRALENSK